MSNQLQNIGRHKERPDLTGEHFLGDAGQILLAFLFFGIWIIDTFFLNYTTFINQYVSIFIRLPVGIIILCISCYLAKAGLSIVFGEVREKSSVIRRGVFNIVRHPIYLGEILLYLGMFLLSISLASLIVCIIAIIFLHYISRHEERLLLERFGDDYRHYMAEVPMWIPRHW
jgi:protein-S-isoprenylcysteine O-methyltransferase Ste14